MNLWQHFIEALESILANKLRAGLTILGIVIGVASVIIMVAIGQGATASVTAQIESVGSNLMYVSQGFGQNVVDPKPLTLQDVNALVDPTNAPDVLAAVGTLQARSTITASGASTSASVVATTADYATMRSLTVQEGEFLTNTEVSGRSASVVLGSGVADSLFGTETGLVGQTVRIQNIPFLIVGVLKSLGGGALGSQDNQVVIPLTTAQSRLIRRGDANRIDQILVQATSAGSVAAAQEEVTNILRTRHNTRVGSDDFNITTQQDILNTVNTVTGTLTLVLGLIGGVSLVVGGIGVMNIMLVSVTERTREIGLRKALGAHKWDIRLQFLMESLVLSILGGLIGVGVAAVVSQVISNISAASTTALNPVIGVDSILLATLFSAAVGLFFGIYPANRASNLEPVEALRYE
jgi:putative ABC transport system permease protein